MPPDLLYLIRRYYSHKTAQVASEGSLSGSFNLETGLGQGCCLAPLLFNIYFGAVIETWLASQPNRVWSTRVDGILRRQADLSKYAIHEAWPFQELGYADDLALITDTLEKLRHAHTRFAAHMVHWGLQVSASKTKALASLVHHVGSLEEVPSTDPPVEFVDSFRYLGSHIDWQLTCSPEITYRLDQARKAFWKLASSVWDVKQLALRTKLRVYRACVLSVLLYACETWTVWFQMRLRLESFHMRCLRKICRVSRWDQQVKGISNEHIRGFLGVPTIMDLIHQARLRWMGHLARMPNDRLPKQALFSFLPQDLGTHRLPGLQGGKRLRDAFADSLKVAGFPLAGWMQLAINDDGVPWKRATRLVACWFAPFAPVPHSTPPCRAAELAAIRAAPIPTRSRGRAAELTRACREIDAFIQNNEGFLSWEHRLAPAASPWLTIDEVASTALGTEWFYQPVTEVVDQLVSLRPDWGRCFATGADLSLFSMSLFSAKQLAANRSADPMVLSPLPPTSRRTRLASKQARPPAFFRSVLPPDRAAEMPDRAVDKYWAKRPALEGGEGPHECPLPGCGRRFTTKSGLSWHIAKSHKQGTYRDRTWDCPHCPRTFELEDGLTKHLPLHRAGAHPVICCDCGAYFPGKPSARMHVNHVHPATKVSLPCYCPYCPGEAAPWLTSSHMFSLHRLKHHVYV